MSVDHISTLQIAIAVSKFNHPITEKLLEGSVNYLIEQGIIKEQLTIVEVPGAVEIPLTAKLLAKSQRYQAIICLGAVIRGDTNHYDYVCQQVSQGCQQVMLQYEIPVAFGILTTNDFRQAKQRVSAQNHKGKEAAETALAMIQVMQKLQEGSL